MHNAIIQDAKATAGLSVYGLHRLDVVLCSTLYRGAGSGIQ
jgi:hypothetical protein